jgi:hypothetical protein
MFKGHPAAMQVTLHGCKANNDWRFADWRRFEFLPQQPGANMVLAQSKRAWICESSQGANMDFPCSRAELCQIVGIGRSKTYELQAAGVISPPAQWFGLKAFCLRKSLMELHLAMGQQAPSMEIIELHWRAILASRKAWHTSSRAKQKSGLIQAAFFIQVLLMLR